MTKKRGRDSPNPNPRKHHTLLATLSKCSGPSLIKHLANCNPSVRSLSLRLLETWLTTATVDAAEGTDTHLEVVSDDDLKKLWKGLFYCVWHCDKSVAQAQLVGKLSSLLVSLTPTLALRYFTNFLLTLRREWPGIDHLRLDKFYLLIRNFIKSMFVLLRKHKWSLDYLGQFVDILTKNAFLAEDKLLGNGVSYHVASVFLDELKGCFVRVESEVVDLLFKPFFSVMGSSLDKVLVGKVKSCVFEELLKSGRSLLEANKKGAAGEDDYDDLAFGLMAMKMGLSGKLYELGSLPGCVQGNRKVVFALHEEFLKLEKEFESSGIEISLPEANDIDDEEVPELIPIESGENAEVHTNGSVDGVNGESEETEDVLEDEEEKSRKNKKAKNGSKENNNKAKKKKKGKKDKVLDENIPDELTASATEDENLITSNGDRSSSEPECDENLLNETVIANLQMQFEKVAAEYGSGEDDTSLSDALVTKNRKSAKKRKRAKTTDVENPGSSELSNQENGVADAGKSSEKSEKKVRFAMKNNLVWKPHNPMPPQSLRIPPSVTPRGSALKKGVPPGPVREMPPAKKLKQKKKGRKMLKTVSPGMKRLQNL